MNRLADLILREVERKGCSIAVFADICGISRNEIGNIVRRKKKDIYVSTVLRICENSDIRISDVFEIDCSIENYVLTNGRDKYTLKKI